MHVVVAKEVVVVVVVVVHDYTETFHCLGINSFTTSRIITHN